MAQFDLPLSDLREYSPEIQEAPDFDDFWSATLALDPPVTSTEELIDSRMTLIDVRDLTFTGFGGAPIKAWLRTPAGAREALPTVVRYIGYSGSRGMPTDARYVLAGCAELVLDSRGQGWWGETLFDGSPDAHPDAGAYGTQALAAKGIAHRDTYYYRRLATDAVRLLQVAAAHPLIDGDQMFVAGSSQGGYLSLVAAGLAPSVGISLAGAMVDLPFMCHIRRAINLTDREPFSQIAGFIRSAPHLEGAVHATVSAFDGACFARRAKCPALFSVGLADTVCPPSTVFAAFNAYGSADKAIDVQPHTSHDHPTDGRLWKHLEWMNGRLASRG